MEKKKCLLKKRLQSKRDPNFGSFFCLGNDKFLDLWTEKRKKRLDMSELGVGSDTNWGKGAGNVELGVGSDTIWGKGAGNVRAWG
jgi:hypothetical protein